MIKRFTLFHRTLVMSLALVLVLVISLALVLFDVQGMLATIAKQSDYVDHQNSAITEQNALVQTQRERMKLQSITLDAYALYSQYLYWRLNAVASGDERSQTEGNSAEQKLREKLAEIAKLDPDLGEAADVVAIYLDDFNKDTSQAFQLVKQGAEFAMISGPMGSAQTQSTAMNAMFETILSEAAKTVRESSLGVLETGQKVGQAADQVLAASQTVKSQGESLAQRVLLILAIGAAVSIGLGNWLAQSVSKPLQRLAKVIVDIESTSDLSQRINYSGNNEIGNIGRAFNSMLETFSGIIRDLASASQRLTEAARDSAAASAQTDASVQQLHSETDQIATASNQMAVTVKGINDYTHAAVSQAQEASAACQQGQAVIAQTLHAMETLSDQILSGAESVKTLASRADKIGSVLDVIRGIAEQTNLLALNAAIEAARAGEQGRGFAVVADEVRTLAQRTGNSTDEIQKMISELQNGTGAAVDKMQSSSEQAVSTMNRASQTTAAVEKILASVGEIRSTNEQISHATEEQMEAANSIDRSITNVSSLAGDVSDAAAKTAASSARLKAMSDALQGLVVKFHV